MTMPFTANLSILPAEQQRLWEKLSETPDEFILYGGTALALRLGHRVSVDFDFFSPHDIDPAELMKSVPYLKDIEVQQLKENTLTGLVDGVQVSFFGLKDWRNIEDPDVAETSGIKVARLIDLAGTKAMVVQARASWKDYVDIHTILNKTDLTLADGLAAGKLIYNKRFNPMLTLKALTYFDDLPLDKVPEPMRKDLVKSVEAVSLTQIKERTAHWDGLIKKRDQDRRPG